MTEEKPEVETAEKNAGEGKATLADLKTLIEKNIKWSQVVYEQNRKIKRRLTWMVVGDYLRLALIIVPIIIAAIYLPPIMKDLWDQYGKVLSGISGGQAGAGGASGISGEQLQQLLQVFGGSR